MPRDQDRTTYAEAVTQAFMEKTGQARLLGSLEFSLIRYWFENHFPLWVILRAFKDTTKPAKSLTYYIEPVNDAMRRHLSPM